MPAEWEPHASTWLAWPHYRGDWPGKFEPIPWVYAEIIRHLARHERVDLIVNNAASEKHARKVLSKASALSKNVRFHRWPTNRVWTRDSGCTFVVSAPLPTVIPSEAGRSLANDPAQFGTCCLTGTSPPSSGASTPGPSIPTISTTKRSAAAWPKLPASEEIRAAARQIPRRPRGRLHRRQRPRHPADHRRMPAQQDAATQSRHVPRGLRKGVCRLSGN